MSTNIFLNFNIFYFFLGNTARWKGEEDTGPKENDVDLDIKEEPEERETDGEHDNNTETESQEQQKGERPKAKLASKGAPSQPLPKRKLIKRRPFRYTPQAVSNEIYKHPRKNINHNRSCDVAESVGESVGTSHLDELEEYQDSIAGPSTAGSSYQQRYQDSIAGPSTAGSSFQQSDHHQQQKVQDLMEQLMNRTTTNLPPRGMRGEKQTKKDQEKRLQANKITQKEWENGERPADKKSAAKRSSSMEEKNERPAKKAARDNIQTYKTFGVMVKDDTKVSKVSQVSQVSQVPQDQVCIFYTRFTQNSLRTLYFIYFFPPITQFFNFFSQRRGRKLKMLKVF